MIKMKNWKIKLLAGALAVACFAYSSCTVVYESKDTDTDAETSAQTEAPELTPVDPPSEEDLAKTAATVGSANITGAEYYFFLYDLAQIVVAQNGSYITMYGGTIPDFNYSLKSQYIMQDTTWYDYLTKDMQGYLEYTYLIAEAGKKAGITLDDDELAEVAEKAEKYEAPEGLSYLTKDVAKKCYEMSALADKYRRHIENTLPEVTEDEINAEFEKNKKNYTLVELNYFPITYTDGTETDTETTAVRNPTKDEAKVYADKFNDCTTTDEFKAVVEEYFKEFNPDATAEDVEYYKEGCAYKDLKYEEGIDILDWAFDTERKDGDVTAIWSDEEKTVHIGTLVKAPYTDDDETASVRHILVEEEEKAKQILDEFNNSDKTSETFGKLAEKYTTDQGSASNGGLYENFPKGEMVAEFENWAFDENRVPGDVEIVKTTYGYHIMYYVSEGLPTYRAVVKSTIEAANLEAVYEQIDKDFKLELNEDFTKELNI